MRIRFVRDKAWQIAVPSGVRWYNALDLLEVPDEIGNSLIAAGSAVLDEKPAPKRKAKQDTTE